MTSLEGRVAIVTGAGRGIGRAHALFLASEGARLVVNDLGGAGESTAGEVAAEIRATGGDAIHCDENVAEWEGAHRVVRCALETYDECHVLVNNAGVIRDCELVEMTEEVWDAVVDVHLKGTVATMRFAGAYWRDRARAGQLVAASIVNTSSRAGLLARAGGLAANSPRRANYATAKAGIATLTELAASELAPFGVRANCVAPTARTRMMRMSDPTMEDAPRLGEPDEFDDLDPGNISPLVAWLSTAGCPVTGRTYWVKGGVIGVLQSWSMVGALRKPGRWTVAELADRVDELSQQYEGHPELAKLWGTA